MRNLLALAIEKEVPAFEGIFDMIKHHKNAVEEIDINKCSQEIMDELNKHPELMKAADDWVMLPDRTLLPKLKELSVLVKKLYKGKRHFASPFKAYRGFDPDGASQDTLGLAEKGFWKNKIKEHKVGDEFEYNSSIAVLSFTPMESIARAFGKTVVEITVDPNKDDYLFLTDEICVLIGKRRNHNKFYRQSEVIMFPPYTLHFTIKQKN